MRFLPSGVWPPPVRFATSTLDGLCDLQGGLGGCEMRGVDDLGLVVQPGASCLGGGLKVDKAEWGRNGTGPLDAPAEGVLVSVQDEVPHRNGMFGETGAISPQYCSTRTVMGMTRVPPM